MNEDHAAEITPSVNPAHEYRCLPHIARPQVAAAMGTAHIAEKI
jgi:hypothetical protein